jgi:hypothetical protein
LGQRLAIADPAPSRTGLGRPRPGADYERKVDINEALTGDVVGKSTSELARWSASHHKSDFVSLLNGLDTIGRP